MRILVAEDNPFDRRLIEHALTEWGYEPVLAGDGDEAWALLNRDDAPHLVILDWLMPGMDGVEICRRLRQRESEHYTYVLLLTMKFHKEDIIAGIESGADDYLPKPFDPRELKVRVEVGRRIVQLQSQLLASRDKFRQQAAHDPLTGLWNRAEIMKILDRELARSRRDQTPLSALMVDVDYFKAINDEHGHQVGDAALCEVGRRICNSVRPYDAVGRYGGEEFLIILPECDHANGIALADRLRLTIADRALETTAGKLRLTVSLGGAAIRQGAARSEDLVAVADRALYRAKRAGRNCVDIEEFVGG